MQKLYYRYLHFANSVTLNLDVPINRYLTFTGYYMVFVAIILIAVLRKVAGLPPHQYVVVSSNMTLTRVLSAPQARVGEGLEHELPLVSVLPTHVQLQHVAAMRLQHDSTEVDMDIL